MDLIHDASQHIKERIHQRYQREREHTKNEAKADAEQRIAERRAEAHKVGEQQLRALKDEADRAADQHYHTKQTKLKNRVEARRKQLKDNLRQAVWDHVEQRLSHDDITAYLESKLRATLHDAGEDQDKYDIHVEANTVKDSKAVAETATKKYEVTFKALVNNTINDYWQHTIKA